MAFEKKILLCKWHLAYNFYFMKKIKLFCKKWTLFNKNLDFCAIIGDLAFSLKVIKWNILNLALKRKSYYANGIWPTIFILWKKSSCFAKNGLYLVTTVSVAFDLRLTGPICNEYCGNFLVKTRSSQTTPCLLASF